MYMRDARKEWELPEDELNALIERFEAISGTKFNDAFADQVNNFIGILREKHLIEEDSLTNKDVKRELTRLRNALEKALVLQNDQVSDDSRFALFSALPGSIEEFINANNAIEALSTACEVAIEEIKGREPPKEFSFTNVRQAMATELARELTAFGVDITAYRDGVFARCLREFFEAFKGTASGQKFDRYVPEDLFTIVKTAKENHTSDERFILLKFR